MNDTVGAANGPLSSGGLGGIKERDDAVTSARGAETAQGALGMPDTVSRLDLSQGLGHLLGVRGGAGDVDDKNGAPALMPSTMTFDVADMAIRLRELQATIEEARTATNLTEIDINGVRLKASHTEQNANYKKSVDSARDAEAKSGGVLNFFKKLFKVVAAVAGLVLSALAAVATGGASAPLLAFAVLGVISASISMVSEISEWAGGPRISVSDLMSKMGTEIAKAFGATGDEAEKIGKVLGNAIGIAATLGAALVIDPSVLGAVAGGIADLAGASGTTIAIISAVATLACVIAQVGVSFKLASGAPTEMMDKLGKMMGGSDKLILFKNVMSGSKLGLDAVATGLGAGQGVAVAFDRQDADLARADAKSAELRSMQIQTELDELIDGLKKIFMQMEEGVLTTLRMVGRASQTHTLLAQNRGTHVGA
jgi:hypothetical protein